MRGLFPTIIIVVTLLCVGRGVAIADPVGLPPVARSTDPEKTDGWRLTLSLTDMSINSVPNMAATAFTREGFITGTATLTADGRGTSRAPLTVGELRANAQLGCQINLKDGVDVGGNNEIGGAVRANADNAGSASAAEGTFDRLNPQITVFLKPGTIDDQAYRLTKKIDPDADDHLDEGGPLVRTISVQDEHIKVDNCGGPVFIRLVAHAVIKTGKDVTSQSTYTVDAYSDIQTL